MVSDVRQFLIVVESAVWTRLEKGSRGRCGGDEEIKWLSMLLCHCLLPPSCHHCRVRKPRGYSDCETLRRKPMFYRRYTCVLRQSKWEWAQKTKVSVYLPTCFNSLSFLQFLSSSNIVFSCRFSHRMFYTQKLANERKNRKPIVMLLSSPHFYGVSLRLHMYFQLDYDYIAWHDSRKKT